MTATNLVGKVIRGTVRVPSDVVDGGWTNAYRQGRAVVVDVGNQYAELRIWIDLDGVITPLHRPHSIVPEDIAEPLR